MGNQLQHYVPRFMLRRFGKGKKVGEHTTLADAKAFKAWLAPLRRCDWVVYAKQPFARPQAVLA